MAAVKRPTAKTGGRGAPTAPGDGDDAAKLEECRAQLVRADSKNRQYEEKCVEYDSVIESFVRKLKEVREGSK